MNRRWRDRSPGTVAALVGTAALCIAAMLALGLQPHWEHQAEQAWREARQLEQQRAGDRTRRSAGAAPDAGTPVQAGATAAMASALWVRLEEGHGLQVKQWRGEAGAPDGARGTGHGATHGAPIEVTTLLHGTYAAVRDGLARGHADPSVELLSLRLQRTDDPGGAIEAEARWRVGDAAGLR